MHLFWGDHPDRITAQIKAIELAGAHGRGEQIGFGMRLQIVCRETKKKRGLLPIS